MKCNPCCWQAPCGSRFNMSCLHIARLTTPPAEARGVLSGASTLLLSLSWRGTAALVWLRSDFWADALRHGRCPCFGARPAPHSRVGWLARVLPTGEPPHLPRE